MITLPNGKVCRSLPEQVAANMNNIQDILNILDGLNIQDNVVAVGDISQILTADELEIVERPVAFILYNNNIYIKKNESGGMAYFDIIFTIVATTVISFNSSEIEVNLSNGALGITNATVSTYSATDIDTALNAKADLTYVNTELAKKANLAGANFTGAITAPSIIEDMSGYVYNSAGTEAEVQLDYIGAVKNGNKLTFVLFGSITPTSSSSSYSIASFTIPSQVGAKLIPATIGGISNAIDFKKVQFIEETQNVVKDCSVRFSKYSDTSYTVFLLANHGLTVGTKYIFRYEATFLLSDSLI